MDWEKLKKQVIHEPKKTLRFIIGLSLTLTVLWVLVLMQTETNGAYVNPNSFTAQPADTSISTSFSMSMLRTSLKLLTFWDLAKG